MITTLTLNPCIDRTINFENFNLGGTNKVLSTRIDVSGKGINTSIALHQLGKPTICIGFNYTDGKQVVERSLSKQGIEYDFVVVEGELRTNIKAFDQSNQIMTEFNESGPLVDKVCMDALYEKLEKYLEKTSILVLNGSVPTGVPYDIYKNIIEMANKRGIRTILDAANDLLLEGIKGKPYIIKPNKDEFAAIFGRNIESVEEAISLSRKIIDSGVKYVCLSMGSEGAMMISKDEAYIAPPLKLDIKGIQGAGDSLVAGMCIAMDKNLGMDEMLRYGVAVASGSLIHEGTKLCQVEDFETMYQRVIIKKL